MGPLISPDNTKALRNRRESQFLVETEDTFDDSKFPILE